METKGVLHFEIIINVSASFEYLFYGSTATIRFKIISVREPILHVRIYKRQNRTSKVGPRTERVKSEK